MNKTSIRYWQVRTIILLWLTYTLLYLGRVNLAVAIPVMENYFGWSLDKLGIISAVFFWVYAFGQLVNGQIADKVSSKLFVFFGLLVSAVANIWFGFATVFPAMVGLWALNGYAQSTNWSSIVKTASVWIKDNQRTKVATFLGTSFMLGYLVSWFVSQRLLLWFDGDWRIIFWVPGGILLLVAVAWISLIKEHPQRVGLVINQDRDKPKDHLSNSTQQNSFLLRPEVGLLAAMSILQGMIKDTITLWAPAILVQTQNLPVSNAVLLAIWIPIMGFGGVCLSGWLSNRFSGNEPKVITLLFGLAAALSFIGGQALDVANSVIIVLVIGFISALIQGTNVQLMTAIPMRFGKVGKSAALSGFLNFFSYLGAGLMSLGIGFVVKGYSWEQVFILWGIGCVIGGVISFKLSKISLDITTKTGNIQV